MDARNIRRYLVTLTPGQFAAKCLIRLAQRFVYLRILRVMKLELPDIDPGFLAEPENFESGYLDREACENFTGVPANRLSQSFVDGAIDRGDTCYAFVREGVLASYGWYSDKPCPIDNRFEFHYDNEYTYMYNGFTPPRYRGHRLHAFGMADV